MVTTKKGKSGGKKGYAKKSGGKAYAKKSGAKKGGKLSMSKQKVSTKRATTRPTETVSGSSKCVCVA